MFMIPAGYKEKIISPSRPDAGQREKIHLFHTSLRWLKRFHKGRKGLRKNFWGTTKRCENEDLS